MDLGDPSQCADVFTVLFGGGDQLGYLGVVPLNGFEQFVDARVKRFNIEPQFVVSH